MQSSHAFEPSLPCETGKKLLRAAFCLGNQRRKSLSECAGQSFGHFDGRFALATLNQTNIGVMDARRLGESFLEEPPLRPVLS